MSSQGTIKRYILIVEKISTGTCPSFSDLKNYLERHGFGISGRTLQRDIEQIRIEFGVEIKYDRSRNGYLIDKNESIDLDSFLGFLDTVATADLLTESLKESKTSLRHIAFESEGNFHGAGLLKDILFAIRNKRKISFVHHNYIADTRKNYRIDPYLLKEYQNRWYVVGKVEDKHFRTFGIDRIEDLRISTEVFKTNGKEDAASLFDNIIGLSYSEGKVEEVILSFQPVQGKYVKSLPLHRSQKIIKDDKKSLVISLDLIPNFELRQKILMMGETVKVLKPAKLAAEIKRSLANALKQY
ncbi:MAG TPA: WYL domain-containing protein [Bacteroidia bacterium]|nr:WYL domain-containing protein [Bacteroidia bacterium]